MRYVSTGIQMPHGGMSRREEVAVGETERHGSRGSAARGSTRERLHGRPSTPRRKRDERRRAPTAVRPLADELSRAEANGHRVERLLPAAADRYRLCDVRTSQRSFVLAEDSIRKRVPWVKPLRTMPG